MKVFTIEIEPSKVENKVVIYDLSHIHPNTIRTLRSYRKSHWTTLEGKNATVNVLDAYNEYSREQIIAIAAKWLDGDVEHYDYEEETMQSGKKRI